MRLEFGDFTAQISNRKVLAFWYWTPALIWFWEGNGVKEFKRLIHLIANKLKAICLFNLIRPSNWAKPHKNPNPLNPITLICNAMWRSEFKFVILLQDILQKKHLSGHRAKHQCVMVLCFWSSWFSMLCRSGFSGYVLLISLVRTLDFSCSAVSACSTFNCFLSATSSCCLCGLLSYVTLSSLMSSPVPVSICCLVFLSSSAHLLVMFPMFLPVLLPCLLLALSI